MVKASCVETLLSPAPTSKAAMAAIVVPTDHHSLQHFYMQPEKFQLTIYYNVENVNTSQYVGGCGANDSVKE